MAGNVKSRFRSLRDRHDKDAADSVVLFDDVPAHLFGPLAEWCHRTILHGQWWKPGTPDSAIGDMCLDLHLVRSELTIGNEIVSLCGNDHARLLDIADWILHPENRHERTTDYARSGFGRACDALEDVLFRAGSAWQVADPPVQLVRRVPKELETEFQQATTQNDPVSEHLQNAWDAAWRRDDPSAVEAYDGAIKAVEGALIPIVIPNDPTATLGKVLAALRAKPAKWDTRFRGEETVKALTALLDELWKTHGRHAQMSPNSLEQSQDAVTVAVAVVALVRRGFIAPSGSL